MCVSNDALLCCVSSSARIQRLPRKFEDAKVVSPTKLFSQQYCSAHNRKDTVRPACVVIDGAVYRTKEDACLWSAVDLTVLTWRVISG